MHTTDKARFFELLKATFAAYAKPMPEGALLASWWNELQSFPTSVVTAAFQAYREGGSDFVPTPAAIAKRCMLCDGRPAVDEAWAIALTSRDESQTVVWTEEMAEAFNRCLPVFPDEVGARMAFKDAYARLVTSARGQGKPAAWGISLGWDKRKREAVLTNAVNVGLLPAPTVAGLLEMPVGEPAPDLNAKKQIAKIKEMLAQSMVERTRQQELHAQAERDAIAERKRVLAEQARTGLDDSRDWE